MYAPDRASRPVSTSSLPPPLPPPLLYPTYATSRDEPDSRVDRLSFLRQNSHLLLSYRRDSLYRHSTNFASPKGTVSGDPRVHGPPPTFPSFLPSTLGNRMLEQRVRVIATKRILYTYLATIISLLFGIIIRYVKRYMHILLSYYFFFFFWYYYLAISLFPIYLVYKRCTYSSLLLLPYFLALFRCIKENRHDKYSMIIRLKIFMGIRVFLRRYNGK